MRTVVGLLGICCLFVSGCARHIVVERSVGRIDPARSVAIYSDTEWKIVREPTAGLLAPQNDTQREAP